MKKISCLLLGILFFNCQLKADTLTIESCYESAKQQYPLIKQRDLIKKSGEFSVANVSKGYLPQLNFSGQASYQSDVTQLPIHIPGVSIPTLSKDQYKVIGEVYQPLTDLAMTKQQKDLAAANTIVQEQQLEVELYKIKDRINQLYFGILLSDAQLNQNAVYKKDLQAAIDKMIAARNNGVALKSDVDALKAEILQADQRDVQLKAAKVAYLDMLSLFINRQLDTMVVLIKPFFKITSRTISRPELVLYEYQKRIYDIQNKITTTKNIPHLGLFYQEGYGRPSLNFLDNTFKFYYVTGIRFNWSINGFYTQQKEKLIAKLGQQLVDNQKELFLFNTNVTLKQQNAEITKLQLLLTTDNDIIELRNNVKNSASAKLENGTLTSSDFIREADKENSARQDKSLHEVQLLLAQYNYQNTTGN